MQNNCHFLPQKLNRWNVKLLIAQLHNSWRREDENFFCRHRKLVQAKKKLPKEIWVNLLYLLSRRVTVMFSKTSAVVVKQLIALNWVTIVFIFDVTVSNLNQKYLCYWLFRDTFPISHPEKLRQSSLGILEERRRIRKKSLSHIF